MSLKTASILLLSSTIIFGSCKKDENKSTKKEIVGLWKAYKVAQDENRNGVRDANENEDFPSTVVFHINLKDDGTGYILEQENGAGSPDNMTWSLSSDGKKLTITYPNDQPSVFNIVSLSGSNLTVQDTNENPVIWYDFKK